MMEAERWVKDTPGDVLVCRWGFTVVKKIQLGFRMQGTKDADLNEVA